MKKITKISIENCRAYYDTYEIILSKGENLLIYGENGSGKSSLFKSFYDFFKNSVSTQKFSKNLYNKKKDGKIELTFSEINAEKTISSSVAYKFSNSGSNNSEGFIKESSLLNGFLDYTDLLKIYLKSEPNPNLYELIILNLLKEFIPVSTGNSTSIGIQFMQIHRNLITLSKNRNARSHKLGLRQLPDFERNLRIILDSIFELVNGYLSNYFDLKDISIEYVLKPIIFKYPSHYRATWFLDTDLRLNVLKNGRALGNEYKDYLNEARLSSVAICLYLASLKLFPNEVEYKLIYLDDIFIGLDTSNRIPILNILNNEFSNYQIIISTYDKNFFEVCNHKLKSLNNWKSIEIYVGEIMTDDETIDIPILLVNNNDLEKARYHLYNNEKPDYPAAANYFRKYLESALKDFFPIEIFKTDDFEEIDSYKLTKILKICLSFLLNFNIEIKPLIEIQSYLFILLHPLSHHNKSASTYKRDLKDIDFHIKTLFETKQTLDFLNNISLAVFKKNTIRVSFFINQYNIWHYEFYLAESLFYDYDNQSFSNSKIICTKYYGTKNKKETSPKKLNRSNSKIVYNSISEAFQKISAIILVSYKFYQDSTDIFECVKIFDGVGWVNIERPKIQPKKVT